MKKILILSLIVTTPLYPQATQAETKELSGYFLDTESRCGDYTKVSLTTENDQCVGLVASKEDGLKRPRRIIELEDGDFIITDMYGWVANKGIVWRYYKEDKKLEKIFTGVDQAHGLALGPDGLVYVGERSKIFRFNPAHPNDTKQYVITNLPLEGNHPLTHFIFDDKGDLYVNAGAPSDQCLDDKDRPTYPCVYEDEAAIRKYTRTSDGSYDANFKVIAQGLRNSMGLAFHPTTGNLYQAENNMDFDKDDGPKEEINLIIEGKHYGWPYCYDDGLLNPKYKRTLLNRRVPNIDCALYESPVETLPSHSAPLDILFYQGEMFPQLQGKLIASLHGYRETGHRIVSLDLNKENSYREMISNWTAESGTGPKGSPVGMTVAKDGSIWFVEDKNKTIMVLQKGKRSSSSDQVDIDQDFIISSENVTQYGILKNDLLKNRCQSCHSVFKGATGDDSDKEALNALIKDKWIIPGDAKASPLWQRVSGSEFGRQMPLSGKKFDQSEMDQVRDYINSLR